MQTLKMNATKILPTYALMTLNIAVMFFMKTKLANDLLETILLLFALIFSFIILKGTLKNQKWAWTAMILLLTLLLFNNIYLFITTKYLPAFLLITTTNLLGIIFFILKKVEDTDTDEFQSAEKAEFESYESISKKIDNAIKQARDLSKDTPSKDNKKNKTNNKRKKTIKIQKQDK